MFVVQALFSSSGFPTNMKYAVRVFVLYFHVLTFVLTVPDPGSAFQWLTSAAVAVQMAGDIILTLALCYVFRKSRTGVSKYGLPSVLFVLCIYQQMHNADLTVV